MRHNMAESLSGKFAEVLQQYQKAQTEYGEKIKAKMIQKVKIGTNYYLFSFCYSPYFSYSYDRLLFI